jgi:flagellar basal-body rod protein FlgF
MGDIVDIAVSVLSQAERRVEIAAQNMANATTPAYKRRVPFATLVDNPNNSAAPTPRVSAAIDFRSGKLIQSGKPSDLALAGPGYFAVRYEDRTVYTRNGQFLVDGEGRLIDAKGGVLQLTSGSDAVVERGDFVVRSDGAITENGVAKGRIAVFATEDEKALEPGEGGFAAGRATLSLWEDARIQQGVFESSNVTTGDEMVMMMEALRRAESGQRVMTTYDDMLGRAINSFGESGR